MVRLSISACLCSIAFSGLLAVTVRPAAAEPNARSSRDRCAPDPDSGGSGLPKPPRPHPIDGGADPRPPRGERPPQAAPVRPPQAAPEKPVHTAPAPPASPSPAPQTGSDTRPYSGPDHAAVKTGARQFRGLVDQGRVRLLNSERDRAQLESLCSDGLFQWPTPEKLPLRHDLVIPDPGGSDTVEPDAVVSLNRDGNGDSRSRRRSNLANGGSSESNANIPGSAPSLHSIQPAPAIYTTEPPGELFRMLNALASQSTDQKPLTITSLLRPPYKTTRYAMQSPHNPHALGIAVDITAFGGHAITTSAPEEEVQAVLALLKSLPPGRYRMGLPKAPESSRPADPGVSVPDTLNGDATKPDFSSDGSAPRSRSSLPSRGVRRQDAGRLPGMPPVPGSDLRAGQEKNSGSAPSPWPFFPPPQKCLDASGKPATLFANEHYAQEQYINDVRLRKALTDARRRGADVFALFPDGVNHVHVDVKPAL